MPSGKPMKSLLGECQPDVCSAWASALQGHGCPAVLWPVPGHQTRERKQPVRTSGCGQQCDGLAEPLGAYPSTQGPQCPLASTNQDPSGTTEHVESPGPGSRHPPTSLGPLPQAPVSAGHAGSGENTALGSQQ